jgi:flagellar motor switch protein FliN/FliY
MADETDLSETEDLDNAGATDIASTLDELEPTDGAESAEPLVGQPDAAVLLGGNQEPDRPHTAKDLDAVYDIPVQLSAVLGKATMQVAQLLKLGRGAVVELDRKVGEAIDIYVNDRLVARGEVVVVEERLGVTMTEIIKSERAK